jgi:parvulin-like peptidyl-prolyl isomerase
MGFVHRGSLSDRFEQIAKDLPRGQISDVVETLYGYHIVRVSEVRPPRTLAFAEVRANIQKDLAAARCTDVRDAWVARLRRSATIVVDE